MAIKNEIAKKIAMNYQESLEPIVGVRPLQEGDEGYEGSFDGPVVLDFQV